MFLHGARYTSQDWVDIGTLKYVRDRGYRTIAVDLPGGRTMSNPIDDACRAARSGGGISCKRQHERPAMLGAWVVNDNRSDRPCRGRGLLAATGATSHARGMGCWRQRERPAVPGAL
eukprot:365819-Chlamydomonas_euryale.AAC.12